MADPELLEAQKREKDKAASDRMLGVSMHINNKEPVAKVAKSMGRTPQIVHRWIHIYRTKGYEALRSKPRSGRPRKVSLETIRKILAKSGNITTPKKLAAEIKEETGVLYHITSVVKIMKTIGFTPKTSKKVHKNKATAQEVEEWQKETTPEIKKLQKEGYAIAIQDESFCLHDSRTGKKYWSLKGVPVITGYHGDHKKVAVYGTISTDKRSLFRTYEKFNQDTFLKYLRQIKQKFGKVVIVMDKASPHTGKKVQKYLEANPSVKVFYLPTATPELSAIEAYWAALKREVLTSEYYEMFSEMKRAVSEYIRTTRHNLDIMKFLARKPLQSNFGP